MIHSRREFPTSATKDDLYTPEIGLWAEEKHRLFWNYASIFTKAMRHKWDRLVYVDLFAGAGKALIAGISRVVYGSPLLALQLPTGFDRFVFCDADDSCLHALRARVAAEYPSRDVHFVAGDVNEQTVRILSLISQYGRGIKVLTFCFADPFKMKNLHFSTLKSLATGRRVDFLVLIPSGMDAARNEGVYLSPRSKTVDRFIDCPDWREKWDKARRRGKKFDVFLTDCFGESMVSLGYIYPGCDHTQLVRIPEKMVRLYRLALFSRHGLGKRFWESTRKYSTPQTKLEW